MDIICYTGVLVSSGSVWAEQRRFSLAALRDLGFGKKTMEDLTIDEVALKPLCVS